tara:strand:+ start:367 stop:681 length:315 start_codon:yes stop_codon:yes gene_type:complete
MKKTYLITQKGKTLVNADAHQSKDGSCINNRFVCTTIGFKNIRDLIKLCSISYEAMLYADARISRCRSNKEYNLWDNARNRARVINDASIRHLNRVRSGYETTW